MNHEHQSFYKGWSITTCWEIAGPPSNWSELNVRPSSWGERFSASFKSEPDTAAGESLHRFPKGVFDSSANAASFALATAKRAIDLTAGGG